MFTVGLGPQDTTVPSHSFHVPFPRWRTGQKSQTPTMLFFSRWGQILLLIGLTLSTANLRAGLPQKRQPSCSVLEALPFLSFPSATFLFYYFKVTNHVVYINLYKANMVILAGLTGTRLAVFGCPTPGLCEL